MQERYVGSVGDFGKLALLRHLMEGRRLAVCWYLTGGNGDVNNHHRHFEYLRRPDEFRHFAPEVFDQLAEIVDAPCRIADAFTAVQMSGLLGSAVFHRSEVPRYASLRGTWAADLVNSVNGTDLVFLDPDHGIQGGRLTARHAALSEIAALRRHDRALVICHRQSGRRAEARYLADQMRSVGCDRIEVIRFRLGFSRFYVVSDHDTLMSERIAEFVRKWGNRLKTYQF